MTKTEPKNLPEIVIPKGYRLDEILDFDDDEHTDEKPEFLEEVKIHFE